MFQKPNKIFILLFLILAILPIMALFHSGLPITHDGQDHVARIANFYQNLSEGVLIPRWAANLNWGYGHPILEFLYPLPSYIASFFHFVGFSLVNSTKMVYALGMLFSLVFMYLWLSQFTTKYAALFGAVLYSYAPYRFVELYVRGDIGENLAFAFIPLVLFSIYKLSKKNNYKFIVLGGFSLAFLILTHNAISLMFVPFIFFYALLLIYFSKERKKYFINLVLLAVLGFSLSCFFWIPALLEAKYTLRNIVTKGTYIQSFVSIQQLIYGPWSYGGTGQFTVQFGLFQWISLIAYPLLITKLKKNKEKLYLATGLLIYTIFAAFLMLPVSNFIWSRFLLLQNFQFPWRFLAIVVFTTAVLGALLFEIIPKKLNLNYVLAAFIVIILFISSFYWHPKAYLYKPASFYTGIYNSTTDTGESSPIWSVRFMEERPMSHMQVIDGSAFIKELKRTSTEHKYQVNVYRNTSFEENTLYFPGWEIKANGVLLPLQFQNPRYRGIMTFNLSKGSYIVEATYKETKLRLFADIISFITIVIFCLSVGFQFVLRKLS
jgi:hypothetical protein